MNLTVRILIGMLAGLVLGIIVQQAGLDDGHWLRRYLVDGLLDAGGRIFIASLQLMVVPLVLVSLICGAASLGNTGNMGRVGGKTLALYLLTTAIAISIALLLASIIQPGLGGAPVPVENGFEPQTPAGFKDTLVNIFPTNPFRRHGPGQHAADHRVRAAVRRGHEPCRRGGRASDGAVRRPERNPHASDHDADPAGADRCLLPHGAVVRNAGLGRNLQAALVFPHGALALIIHLTVVYPLLLSVLARVNPLAFLRKMREPMLVAFSTASSNATLPVTLRTVEHRLGVKNEVAAFAVPLGATINMDGTAIMQGVATVFIAQFYAIDLSLGDYLMVIATATLASIGTAGVPGVGLIMLTMVLTQVGLPVEGIMLIIGVDRMLDMLRTAVNITGDGMVATIVARSEDDLDLEIYGNPDAGSIDRR
jgi:Na+/H+-dicarboxylate symporter